jgi:hypothetical protein
MRTGVYVLSAIVIGVVGVLFGYWWAPFVAGAAIGLLAGPARVGIPFGALCGLVSWLLPLAGTQVRYGLGPTSSSLAAIMGFGHQGAVPLILSLIVGTLLGVTGAWLAYSARRVVRPAPR